MNYYIKISLGSVSEDRDIESVAVNMGDSLGQVNALYNKFVQALHYISKSGIKKAIFSRF